MHAGTPPAGADSPPLAQSMLGHTVNAQVVRIRLECNLVKNILSPFFKTETIFKYKSKIVHQHILIQGVSYAQIYDHQYTNDTDMVTKNIVYMKNKKKTLHFKLLQFQESYC